jgi:hypothetical protein
MHLVFPRYVLFFRLQNCVWGDFLILQKCPGFWPLLIVALNFLLVIMYIIVHSSHRQCFNFRTYFHSHFRLIRMHSGTAWFQSFILNFVQCSRGRVVCYIVRMPFLLCSYTGESKM